MKINVMWNGGYSDVFLKIKEEDTPELLVYEFDHQRIHEECGGRLTYRSQTGLTGEGYIETLGSLIRVGAYRVDTRFFDWQCPVKIGMTPQREDVTIMVPFVSHKRVPYDHPVIVRGGDRILVYCHIYEIQRVVMALCRGDESKLGRKRTLEKEIRDHEWGWGHQKTVRVDFYNLDGNGPYPWVFLKDRLAHASIADREDGRVERLYSIFGAWEGESGWERTERIDDGVYTVDTLDGDPFSNPSGDEPVYKGRREWTKVFHDESAIIMKTDVRENFVRLVGWTKSVSAYQLKADRLMRFIPEEKRELFKKEVERYAGYKKYVEFELTVPKMVWQLDRKSVIGDVRKGIAKKISSDVVGEARCLIEAQKFSDEEVAKRLPDEAIITEEDSYAAGNCQPGTQAFIDRYFPGRTSVSARELKEHIGNPDVLRVLRHVARTRYGKKIYGEEAAILLD